MTEGAPSTGAEHVDGRDDPGAEVADPAVVTTPAAPAVQTTPAVQAVQGDAAAGAPTPAQRPGQPQRSGRRWPGLVLAALLVVLLVGWGGWLASGGRVFWVGSPSMGEVAPVGSLVITRPVGSLATIHVGEIMVFHPPGTTQTYVHRIYSVGPGPTYRTKGDINTLPDPWVIGPKNLVGREVAIVPAVGTLYRSAAWLFIGAAVLLVAAWFTRGRARRAILVLAPVVLVGVPLWLLRPLIGGQVLLVAPAGSHLAVRAVATGILPERFTTAGFGSIYAAPGQVVTVAGRLPSRGHATSIQVSAALPWWGWLCVALFCLVPVAFYEWHSRRATLEEQEPAGDAVGDGGLALAGEAPFGVPDVASA